MNLLIKSETFLRLFYRKSKSAVKRALRYAYDREARKVRNVYHNSRSMPLMNQVLYEAYDGKSVSCNPEAIFRALLADPEHSSLIHIWALRDLEKNAAVIEEFSQNRRVKFVVHGSSGYWSALARSKFLVNNVTFPAMFFRRDEQIYLNTWHGVPLKAMGFEVPRGSFYSRNVYRNFIQATHIISSGPWMTERIYRDSYKFGSQMLEKILEVGSPRVDVQFTKSHNFRAELRALGISAPDDSTLLLWAPTWRGSSVYSPSDDTLLLSKNLVALNQRLAPHGITVLLKAHQTIAKRFAGDLEIEHFLVPDSVSTNRLLASIDGLITDYSSIYFDFLVSEKAIFLHCYDLEEYTEVQGLIVDPRDLPGRYSSSFAELLTNILESADEAFVLPASEVLQQVIERYIPRESGTASKDVIEAIFSRTDPAQGTLLRQDQNLKRQRVIIFPGGMDVNGISTSAVNFASNLCPDKYDISMVFTVPAKGLRRELVDSLPTHIRIIERVGELAGTTKETKKFRELMRSTPRALLPGAPKEKLADEEYRRVLGQEEFDIAIDFQGYNVFWSLFIMRTKATRRLIWQHNDLYKETQKVVDGRLKHAHNLQAVFSMYENYDYIVSVSEELSNVNRHSLKDFAPTDRFVSLKNLINEEKILMNANSLALKEINSSVGALAQNDLLSALRSLAMHHSIEELAEGLSFLKHSSMIFDGDPKPFVFVTVGRLSPEKNHVRLIEAFKIVHEAVANTKLIIIGGGPLKRELESLVKVRGLSNSVIFTGFLGNPHQWVAQADAFVLSSDYEGQPMVLLEAQILGLPIVTVDFGSVRGAVSPDQALITASTVEALAAGMESAISGQVPTMRFNAAKYNDEILSAFEDWVTPPQL